MIHLFASEIDEEGTRLQAALALGGVSVSRVGVISDELVNGTSLVLADVKTLHEIPHSLPRSRLIAFGGNDKADDAVQVLQTGVRTYIPQGASADSIFELIRTDVEAGNKSRNHYRELAANGGIAHSLAMQKILQIADKVAQAQISVLIAGESGTGKEVLARYLHEHSPRAGHAFVALNCAAIPETMMEAVLFGHEKGAYTGASEKRIGKFELADKGTLLLDEITEMPVGLQAKLLRVLQEREVERLGSHKTRKVDVRILATSNRNLKQAMKDGLLREDLYFRLSVLPLNLPPLRDRKADIEPLAHWFIHKHGAAKTYRVGDSVIPTLQAHQWPGNVRELENCIQRALVLCDNAIITVADLALEEVETINVGGNVSLLQQMRSQEERVLMSVLAKNNGVRKSTAVQLGISERTLRHKLKQLRDRGIFP